MEFDYLKILRGYILGIMEAEGIDYQDRARGLTGQEQAELKRICDELCEGE